LPRARALALNRISAPAGIFSRRSAPLDRPGRRDQSGTAVRPEPKVCQERRARLERLVRRGPKAQRERKVQRERRGLRAHLGRLGLKDRLEATG
jgi:hypothetical protein